MARKFGLSFALCALVFAGCSAYSRAISRGDELSRKGEWEAAESAYLEAQKADPSHPEAELRIQNVRNKRAEAWVDRGDAARKQMQLDEALHDYVEGVKIAPANPRVAGAFQTAIDERISFAEGDLRNGALESAEHHVQAVLGVRPELPKAQSLLNEIIDAFAKRSFQTAEDFEKKGELGNALVEYLRADERRVGATPAREHAEVVRRKLRDELMWFIAQPTVIDRTTSPDIAQRLGPGRLAQTYPPKLPITVVTEPPKGARGVRLTLSLDRVLVNHEKTAIQRTQRYLAGMKAVQNPERKKNEEALLHAERQLEEIDDTMATALRRYSDAQAAVDRSRDEYDRCSNDAIATCQRSIDACRTEAQSLAEAAAQPPQPGAQPAPRPTPCQATPCSMDECRDCKDHVKSAERAQSDLRLQLETASSASARQRREIQRLRDLVYRTPLTVDEPMYADFVYDIDVHTVNARALVTMTLDDLQSEPSRAPVTLEYLVSKADETHKGYEKYGILVDPLVMPNEMDLRIELGEKALVDVGRRVRARFDIYKTRWTDDARRSLPRAGAEDAVETLVRALFVSADAPPKDIVEALARAKDLKNPLALLAQ